MIGGFLYEEFGCTVLWRSAAFAALGTGILYVVFTQILQPFLSGRECFPAPVAADTQDFFEDDLDDLLDNDIAPFQNFTSDEEYLILDAPGDYSIVNSKGEKFVTPERDPTGGTFAAANRGQLNQTLNAAGRQSQAPLGNGLNVNREDRFTIEDINV